MPIRHRSGPSDRRYVRLVRTTVQIHDDVLEAARCIADDEHASIGEILSRLARRGLDPRPDEPAWNRLPPSMTRRPPSVTQDGATGERGVAWEPW